MGMASLVGETRSPRRVSPNVEEEPSAECPIGPGSTRPSSAAGCGEPGTNLGHEVLVWRSLRRTLPNASSRCAGACSRNTSAGVAALLLHGLLLAAGAFSRERPSAGAGGMDLVQVTMFEAPLSQLSAARAAEPAGAPLRAAPAPVAVRAPRVARALPTARPMQPTREATQPEEPEERESSDGTGSGDESVSASAASGAGNGAAGSARGEGAGTGSGATVV